MEGPTCCDRSWRGEQNRQKLATATNRELAPALISSLDNQFYFMMTGRKRVEAEGGHWS